MCYDFVTIKKIKMALKNFKIEPQTTSGALLVWRLHQQRTTSPISIFFYTSFGVVNRSHRSLVFD